MKCKTKSNKTRRSAIDITVKLPEEYPWKVLGLVADDLRPYLQEDDYNLVKLIVRNKDMSAYQILTEDWGLQSISSSCHYTFEFQCRYILAALLKKYRFPSDKNLREEKAFEKFLEAESLCREYNQQGYLKLVAPKDDITPVLLTYAREYLRKLLGDVLPGYQEMTEWSRHGPGATLDTCHGLVSSFHKFENWPYSCTIDALRYSRFVIQSDQRWFGALQDDYRDRFNISKQMPLNMELFWTRVLKVVDTNRICFVPKNALIDRSIAIEPTLNLYLQLGVDGFIRRRLKRFGIDLDDQAKNQELARLGSVDDSYKSFVTIDLSAASDLVSTKLVEVLFPREWYTYLMDLRSPQGVCKDQIINYGKISSMGCGYTFALESAIFSSAIFAVQKFIHGRYKLDRCAVFGDDLIVEKYISDLVIDLLAKFGFTVNTEKSFLKGPIRESCGTDWFQGRLVRPVFFDELPTDAMDLLTDVNRLDRLLSVRCGLEESNCSTLMEKWIPEKIKRFVGPRSDEEFDSYRHVSNMPEVWRFYSALPKRNGFYKNGLYVYKRLVKQPVPMTTRKFLLQKLMHNLRPLKVASQKWDKTTSSGSRFTITRRGAESVAIVRSVSDIWKHKYEGEITSYKNVV